MFSVYLVVPLFVLTGVAFGQLWRDSQLHRQWAAAALGLFAIVLPWLVNALRQSLFSAGLWSRMFVTAAITILLVAGLRSAPSVFRASIALLLLLLLFIGPARESTLYTSGSSSNRDDFCALMSFNEVLKASVPLERRAVFWVDPDEPDYNLFISAKSLWVFGAFDFNRAFHAAAPDEIRTQLSANTTLVHLTNRPERIGQRLELLNSRGVRYANERQWTVRSAQTTFHVAAQDILDISAIR